MTCQPFFSTPERIDALLAAAKRCEGTPFAAKQMAPGKGIDCVRVPAWCFLQTGFFKKFTPPNYAMDSGAHSHKSHLIEWFENWTEENRKFVRVETPQAGDCLCLQNPKTLSAHHCALVIDENRFEHAIYWGQRRVIISGFKESFYLHRIRAVFRPMEVAP